MAVIGGVAGWFFGDYVAKKLNLSGWRYWTVRVAVTAGGAAIGWFAGGLISSIAKSFLLANPAVMAKMPSWVLTFLGIKNAVQGYADKAAQLANKFTISSKHLMSAKGNYAKFATNSTQVVRQWVQQALSSNSKCYYNSADSYYKIVNMGITVGTKGQTCIKVIFTTAGKIISAYPVK